MSVSSSSSRGWRPRCWVASPAFLVQCWAACCSGSSSSSLRLTPTPASRTWSLSLSSCSPCPSCPQACSACAACERSDMPLQALVGNRSFLTLFFGALLLLPAVANQYTLFVGNLMLLHLLLALGLNILLGF